MQTYGRVDRTDAGWWISCEPQVKARLKRVFAKVRKQAANTILLSATPENSRDLLWFLERYPMDVPEMARLQAESQSYTDMQARLSEVLDARRPPSDVEMALPPRLYQRYGSDLLLVRKSLLLADDVGLGKSVTAMCPMTVPEHLPAVIVCPAHMPRQWAAYLKKFLPGLRVHIIKKGQPYDLIKPQRGRQVDMWPDRLPDVIIVTYHKLRGWAETLAEIARYAVMDECQQLRNPGSDIYTAAKMFLERCSLKIGLSATPIYNYGSEFHHVINALMPDVLGTYEEFTREWCTDAHTSRNTDKIVDAEQFGAYLRREGIMLRRTRAEVGRELPPVSKIAHTIEMDTDVLSRLTGPAIELARTILSHNERYRGEHRKAAGEFDMLMRQATGVAKAPYVANFVRMLVEAGEKVILFGWHRDVYAIWLERLADLNPVMFTGTETAAEKNAALEAFKTTSPVLIMSLRSAAGIDGLQYVTRNGVFGELDWSPGVHEQCIGRYSRDGQDESCNAFYMLADDGSDPVVSEVLGVKFEQVESVRNPGGGLIERIDNGENQIRKLAAAFLTARGEALPEPPPPKVTELAGRIPAESEP